MDREEPVSKSVKQSIKRWTSPESLASILSLIFFLFAIDAGYRGGNIIVDSYVYSSAIYFVVFFALMTAAYVISLEPFKLAALYIGTLLTSFYALAILFMYGSPVAPALFIACILQVISLVRVLRSFHGGMGRTIVSVSALLVMLYLGNILQLVNNRPGTGMVVESNASVFAALGQSLPLLESGGMFILTDHFDFILSIQQFLLFSVLAGLIAENYYQIIRLVRTKGGHAGPISAVAYSLTGALSCQCESYISVLPALSFLLINYILLPVVVISIILLIATYFLVVSVYMPGRKPNLFRNLYKQWQRKYLPVLGIILLILSPFLLIAVVFYGVLSNAFYFFISGMMMALVGYIFVLLVSRVLQLPGRNSRLDYILGISGTILFFSWFYPTLTQMAYEIPYMFVLMNISMLVAGILFGIIYTHNPGKWGDLLNEYLSTALGVFSLILFYVLATFQVKIWPFFTFQSQFLFALYGWVAMVPVMWLTTQVSLYRLSSKGAISPA
ncbi:MAG: hypothetical protein M1138_02880 [Candidatus Thermoplasmatota archaeon]|nr:hypothetical protein [Candidatus Thermoplasmatota archaeon]